jgi:hypothetical protein
VATEAATTLSVVLWSLAVLLLAALSAAGWLAWRQFAGTRKPAEAEAEASEASA